MTLTFTRYAVSDSSITLTFTSPDPGAGQPSDYDIVLTDADIAGVSTAAQFRTLVLAKLRRKLRGDGIASRLDPFIGQSLEVL